MLIFLVLPRLSCLDVMQGSVRRKQQTPEGDSLITPGSPHTRHQFTIRFKFDGSDSSALVSLGCVLVAVTVRHQNCQDVELVISPQNITDNLSIWSEHIIRSYKPTVSSLRSKLCQVYSTSHDRQTCRLSSLGTLQNPDLGYLDINGYVSLNVR